MLHIILILWLLCLENIYLTPFYPHWRSRYSDSWWMLKNMLDLAHRDSLVKATPIMIFATLQVRIDRLMVRRRWLSRRTTIDGAVSPIKRSQNIPRWFRSVPWIKHHHSTGPGIYVAINPWQPCYNYYISHLIGPQCGART